MKFTFAIAVLLAVVSVDAIQIRAPTDEPGAPSKEDAEKAGQA